MTSDDLLFRHRLRLFARAGEVGVSQACRELHYHRSSSTAGRTVSTGKDLRSCGPGSVGCLGCSTRPHPRWSTRSWSSRWENRGWGRDGWRPRWRCRNGVAGRCRRRQFTASCGATGSTRAGSGWRWSPATPALRNRSVPRGRSRFTSKPSTPAIWSSSTASTLAASAARGSAGSTPPLTSPARTCGPKSTRVASTPRFATPRPWSAASPTSSALPVGSSRPSLPTTAQSFVLRSSATRSCTLAPSTASFRAGRLQTNGCVERVQRTVLEECWRPTFARSRVVKLTALKRDLADYLNYYNWDLGHTGRNSNRQPPGMMVYGSRKMRPR